MKDTTAAMSSGCPSLSRGGSLVQVSMNAFVLPRKKSSVATAPGATQLAVILVPLSSLARILMNVSTAALLEV